MNAANLVQARPTLAGVFSQGQSRLVVVWRVYEPCGLDCAFCGYARSVVRRRVVAEEAEVLRVGRLLGQYAREHQRPVLVSWLGGEPLAWPALPRISRALCDDCGLQLSVTASGVPLASRAIRQMLCETHREITVSMDGLRHFHDRVRKMPGLFDAVRQDVGRLRDEAGGRLLLRVNTILMRENIESFEAFCHEMAAWGFDELTFNQLGGADRPDFHARQSLLAQQVVRFRERLPGLRAAMAEEGLRISGSETYLDRILDTALHRPAPVEDCKPGSQQLFIDEQGRIGPCSFTSGLYGEPLEQIHAPDDLAALPLMFRDRRQLCPAAACQDCRATHVFGKFAEPAGDMRYPYPAHHPREQEPLPR